jgi:hypothetical protein
MTVLRNVTRYRATHALKVFNIKENAVTLVYEAHVSEEASVLEV